MGSLTLLRAAAAAFLVTGFFAVALPLALPLPFSACNPY
jgi:hypothetical protein